MAANFIGSTETGGYLDTKSAEERRLLIESMLPLVNHIVSRMVLYFPPHVAKDDLISAGVIGLIEALNRYDPARGASVKTYCSTRVRGAVLDELRRLDWVPRSVHRDAKLLQTAQDVVAQRLNREPDEEEVREEMGLSAQDFYDLLERVKPCTCFSLNEPVFEGEDGESLTHEEVLADNDSQDAVMSLLNAEDKGILRKLVEKLPAQQIQVLSLYYMENLRLKEIALILGITESRVSQIHTLAISRLRSAFMKARQT